MSLAVLGRGPAAATVAVADHPLAVSDDDDVCVCVCEYVCVCARVIKEIKWNMGVLIKIIF